MNNIKGFELEIISPYGTFCDDGVESIIFDAISGKIQILPNHIAFAAVIVPSSLEVKTKKDTKFASIMKGFIWFNSNHGLIITDAFEWSYDIDINRAKSSRERALERIKNKGDKLDLKRADMALERAIARIKLSERKGSKPIK